MFGLLYNHTNLHTSRVPFCTHSLQADKEQAATSTQGLGKEPCHSPGRAEPWTESVYGHWWQYLYASSLAETRDTSFHLSKLIEIFDTILLSMKFWLLCNDILMHLQFQIHEWAFGAFLSNEFWFSTFGCGVTFGEIWQDFVWINL